ncbi:neuraminidase-like domain-containing protein [Photorhabdus luminescens]|uniref:Tc toxin subunit A-related protein n=1 Tax=Photorhabdus luminescens TaxID=29488 RepID=UPI00223F556C|nr:neuraminidase-like domain-containing protein [Photorhabdus luminescens]MCW7760422.1 neuraminidase-like domain-containing protein [Photorhabdus luminescens subsp. venezuelensis]
MSENTIEAYLLEAQRDALLDYFIGQVVAHSPAMEPLRDDIKNVDDVYDYLLLDVMVSAKVNTSRVAMATNTLQQYINRISLNIEKGLFMTVEESENWQEFANRYNYWSADRMLRTYPESYLEPMLRLNKTEFFFQLESSLNQGKITEESVQQAVLGYLNNFEDVSNLEVIASYEDGVDTTRDKFFFIGRTRTQPYQYYWRSLNLSIRHPDTDALSPNAWSEWRFIDLPLGGVKSTTIRPIFLNNRLYIAWAESEEVTPTTTNIRLFADEAETPKTYNTQLKIAYAKYDGTWSAPSILRESELPYQMNDMVAVMDIMQGEPKLAIVAFTRLKGVDPIHGPYDYDYCFEFICDTLLAEITDLPDTSEKYAADLVWYYSREHKDESGNPIPYRTMVLYPATRNTKFMIAGEAKEEGNVKLGKGTIELVVDFVYGSSTELQLTARSTFDYGSDPIHDNFPDEIDFCIWQLSITKTKNADGKEIEVQSEEKLGSVTIHKHQPVPELVVPRLDLGDHRSVKLKAGIDIMGGGSYTNDYRVGMLIRPLVQFKEERQVQYLSLPADDTQNIPPTIRLNTLFAKELISRASQGIHQVLSWDTQHIKELPLPPHSGMTAIDLDGANGIYFWELFFHMPFLVAWRLNIEQRLEEATQWLHYIFNPLEDAEHPDLSKGKPRYWNSRPLIDPPPKFMRSLTQPTDPDAIAASEPIHYRKAIFRFYLKNLLDQGDREYRKLTQTSRIVARLTYASANNLLGTSPDIQLAAEWKPRTLEDTATYTNTQTRQLEMMMTDTLPLLPVTWDSAVANQPSDLFRKPVDTEYLKLWEELERRIYNLRHNLTLDGKEYPAGLFDEPISPRDLLKQRYQRVVDNRQAGAKRMSIPNYRFAPVFNRAMSGVETLIQYGNSFLSLLERKDSLDFERFRMQQQLGLYSFTVNLQQQTIDINQASLDALNVSRRAALERKQHYQTLYDEDISSTEQQVIELQGRAADAVIAAQAVSTAGAVADLVPNIFGFAVGGMQYGAPLRAIAEGIRIEYESKNAKANSLSVSENYRRRRQEWEIQYKQAEINVEEIDQQIAIQSRQLQASITQLAHIQAQREHDNTLLEYFSQRFTSESLYMWMISQISALYLQAYDAVMSLCLSAEASWQYETGKFDTQFIQSGGWNDLYQGLLVGESLKLSLLHMDQEYMKQNVRRLEVVKTISLKSLLTSPAWEAGKSTGNFNFSLDSEMFLRDYPGHIDRRIKTVSVSLATLVGPYQDIRATLVQNSNSINYMEDPDTIDYLLNPVKYGEPLSLIRNLQTNQAVVLSTGINDSGMFQLDFQDERFLPFEGTGVFSNWTLTFGDNQSDLLEKMSDIIIHLRYTARSTSDSFAKKVKQQLLQHEAQKKQD